MDCGAFLIEFTALFDGWLSLGQNRPSDLSFFIYVTALQDLS